MRHGVTNPQGGIVARQRWLMGSQRTCGPLWKYWIDKYVASPGKQCSSTVYTDCIVISLRGTAGKGQTHQATLPPQTYRLLGWGDTLEDKLTPESPWSAIWRSWAQISGTHRKSQACICNASVRRWGQKKSWVLCETLTHDTYVYLSLEESSRQIKVIIAEPDLVNQLTWWGQ